MKRARFLVLACSALLAATVPVRQSRAWGPEAHRVIALFAEHVLQQSDAAARAKLVALLATDKSNSWTKTDVAGEAIWADVLRQKSEEARSATMAWHYVRLKADGPDLQRDCFGRPPLPEGIPASHGPQDNCVVDKIEQFAQELKDPATSEGERLAAAKFLLNLVGDIHEPLYAIDHGDRGGRCVAVAIGGGKPVSLLSYWDDTLVTQVTGKDPARGAVQVAAGLVPTDAQKWASGTPEAWAQESYEIAKTVAYGFGQGPAATKYDFPALHGDKNACGPVNLYHADAGYETKALAAVKEQLAKAGMRLAMVLRDSLR